MSRRANKTKKREWVLWKPPRITSPKSGMEIHSTKAGCIYFGKAAVERLGLNDYGWFKPVVCGDQWGLQLVAKDPGFDDWLSRPFYGHRGRRLSRTPDSARSAACKFFLMEKGWHGGIQGLIATRDGDVLVLSWVEEKEEDETIEVEREITDAEE